MPQEEVFEYCVNDIIKTSVKGYNGTVFAYGQTGSGKTFTISGTPSNFSYRGIVPRAISRLFQEISNKPEFEFKIQISYLEIYNEIMFDLLPENQSSSTNFSRPDISFQEDAKGNVLVKGLSKHIVTNEEEAFNLLFEGESNRTVSEHQLNKGSTRSHCIFTIHLEMKSRIESNEKVMISKLNFVDLAGSERVKQTGSTGLTLKEATYINKSLTFLEQVVVALTERKTRNKDHVPYRQSKLTHILKDSIGGNCKTVMVCTIWPEERFIHETLSALNFAKRMKNVVNEMSVNIQLDTSAQLRKLTKEIKELKQELAMHNTLANRGRINYDPYSPEEQEKQKEIARKYLLGQSEDLEFDSVRQAKEIFYQIRYLYQKLKTQGPPRSPQKERKEEEPKKEEELKKEEKKEEEKKTDKKGEKKEEKKDEKKDEKKEEKKEGEEEEEKNEEVEQEEEKKESLILPPIVPRGVIPDKNTAFLVYKAESEYSQQTENLMKLDQEKIKQLKEEAKQLLDQSNVLKEKLEKIKEILNEKKLNKQNLADEMTNVIDDEEYKLKDEQTEIRKQYKEIAEKFREAKKEISTKKENLEITKIKYVENFENWFLKKYGIRVEENELRLAKAKYGINIEDEKEIEKPYDPDEIAYMNAKRKVQNIHRAKRIEKMK